MSESQVVIFSITLLGALLFMIFVLWLGSRIFNQPPEMSPYTGKPLRLCRDLSYYTKERILRYLFFLRQYDNRIFDIEKAAFCRDTGRIFQNCITIFGAVKVDWTFLNKRYPGSWVSWGSLTEEQQRAVKDAHHKLEGYQMEFSSPEGTPHKIAKEYAYSAPGPLYVDMDTKTLLGWKEVPGTEFEVLIVTKPRGIFETPRR